MKIVETGIKDLLVFEPRVHEDSRGYFFESYNQNILKERGIETNFIQDNQSKSQYGVIRGLHYQKDPHAQTKLLRVLEGRIFDVAVDLRKSSPDFGKWYGLEISADNRKQIFIPKGFAHGFSVLSDIAVVLYKCDEFYHPESEAGISYADAELYIDWQIDPSRAIVSQKDLKQPDFKNSGYYFD